MQKQYSILQNRKYKCQIFFYHSKLSVTDRVTYTKHNISINNGSEVSKLYTLEIISIYHR